MPDELSVEDRLELAEAKLKELLDRHRRLEEDLRWVDDRQNELSKWCDEAEATIAYVRRARSNGRHA
jgi:hypothetical protein